MRHIRHGTLSLALHELRAGGDPPLLLLHELGGSSSAWTHEPAGWHGPVFGLDFAGHGDSDWRPGGAYTPELLAADADAALVAVGACAIAGAGLGAYVALLLAGARPDLVPAALLLPGAGLEGGGPQPYSRLGGIVDALDAIEATGSAGWDPMLRACAEDVRPPEYAAAFGTVPGHLLLAEDGSARPPWWERLRALPNVRRVPADTTRALVSLRTIVGR